MDLTKIMIEMELREVRDFAKIISEMYIQNFPRPLSFGVELEYGRIISIPQNALTEEEVEILRDCSKMTRPEYHFNIIEVLNRENHEDIAEKIFSLTGIDHYGFFEESIKSIDLNNPQYAEFTVKELNTDGSLGEERNYSVPLTNDEYKEILEELIFYSNCCTMNMLIYNKPQISEKIMRYLSYATWREEHTNQGSSYVSGQNPNPFIVEMSELKSVCERILNPFVDDLGLFDTEDNKLKETAIRQQIIPGCKEQEEFYHCYENHLKNIYKAIAYFKGKDLLFYEESWEDSQYVGVDKFKVNTIELLKRFKLEMPKDIIPYLKEHYQCKNCLQQLRNDLKGLTFMDDWSNISLEERYKEMEDETERKLQACYAEMPKYESEDTECESLEELEAQGILISADKMFENLRKKYSLPE